MMQVPAPPKVTLPPETAQTPLAAGSIVNATGSPELAVAATVYGEPPAVASAGAADVKVTLCDARPTTNDCCASGAAFQSASPAWLASTTQVPAAVNVTSAPEMEHTDAALASMLKATGNPDVDVAVTVYPGPPKTSAPLGVDVNTIVCSPGATAKDCCTCGAG